MSGWKNTRDPLSPEMDVISIEEALQAILSQVSPLDTERVTLNSASGRGLGEDIVSHRDSPPMDNAAMDGFALRFEDARESSAESPQLLKIIGEQPAGGNFQKPVGPGETVRIMTGAMMPKGADTVVQVEHTKDGEGNSVAILIPPKKKGLNVRRQGEYFKKGDTALRKGTELGAQHISLIASLGLPEILVFRRPTVSILATGNELVDVGEAPADHQIVNSNNHLLVSLVAREGGIPVNLGIARDEEKAIEEKLRKGCESDILISSGGVSVGNYDLVKQVLERMGSELAFWKVAIKPGKPLVFGRLHGKFFFGLPGNPVASYIAFHQFVKPVLRKMNGFSQFQNQYVRVRLDVDIPRKADQRTVFMASLLTQENGEFVARPLPAQSSGNLKQFCDGNGFVILPGDREIFKKGERVAAFFSV